MLSIIIPAYNEEESLGKVISRTKEVAEKLTVPYEIIVVDDGSTDRTSKVAMVNGVKLIRNDVNLGKGASLRRGFYLARGSVIVTIDADGSHQPEDIPLLLSPIQNDGVDAVIGARRYLEGSRKVHKIGNAIINFLVHLLLGIRISDTQSGFRSYRKSALEKLNLKANRFDIETETLAKLTKGGFHVVEKEIICNGRANGSTNIRPFSDGFKILIRILESLFSE